jgi:flagellar assembly protein FliH
MKAFDIKAEPTAKKSDFKVSALEPPKLAEWQEYDVPKLRKSGDHDYQATRGKFGPLAATEATRHEKSRKDSRFAVNPLLREPLSIEDEERRAINARVEARVKEIADEARKQAFQEGYSAGLKKGHDEAYTRIAAEGKDRLVRFDSFLSACDGAKEEIYRASERFVMELVYRIARMVVLREVKQDPELVLRIAKGVLERLGIRENIKITISPKDRDTAGALRAGLEESFGKLQNLTVEVSEDVGEGGCLVETQWNAIDASIETQLENIHKAILGEGGA